MAFGNYIALGVVCCNLLPITAGFWDTGLSNRMMKIRMGKVADIPPGKALEKRIMARRVAVFNDRGTLYGIEADCKHMKASLTTGGVADGIVTCKWHHWRYDLRTGECLGRPDMRLKRYDVIVEGDDVFLVM